MTSVLYRLEPIRIFWVGLLEPFWQFIMRSKVGNIWWQQFPVACYCQNLLCFCFVRPASLISAFSKSIRKPKQLRLWFRFHFFLALVCMPPWMNSVPVGYGRKMQKTKHRVWVKIKKNGLTSRQSFSDVCMSWPRPFGHPSLARSWVFTHSKFDSIVCLLVCLLVCVPLCCCCCGGFAADLATRSRKRKRHMQAQTTANANISRKRSGIHRKKTILAHSILFNLVGKS